MSEQPDSPRSGGFLPSQGIEWSLIWLSVGILGMVFLLFSVLGKKSDDQSPAYERDSQIVPRSTRDRENSSDQPEEVGAPAGTEST